MKYAIIENEFFSLEHLKSILAQLLPAGERIFTAESVQESVVLIEKHEKMLDLIFMDIELVDGNCFEIFKKIEVNAFIIFTTAYNQYALKAFKVNSVDYLLKPVTEDAVRSALEKYRSFKNLNQEEEKINFPEFKSTSVKSRILILKGDEISPISIQKIAYFISEDKYIFAFTFDGKKHMTQYPNLSDLEQILPAEYFFRVSRNAVLNVDSIDKVSKYFNGRLIIHLKNSNLPFDLVVSAAKRETFLSWLS